MELLDKNGRTEAEAIAIYKTKNYPKPALTADNVIFRREDGKIKLLLIKRGGHPFLGKWALPGGFADMNEPVEHTAARELEEETGLTGIPQTLTGFYSAPGRDPRGWVVSAAFAALLEDGVYNAQAADDADAAAWFEVSPDGSTVYGLAPEDIAFDHARIIADAARAIL